MEKTTRTHRVGSLTAGFSMVAFGIMFLVHMIVPALTYGMICRFWPVMLILLGVELLISNVIKKELVYDKAAIVLMFVVMLFAMGMAGADMCLTVLSREYIG